MFENFLGLKVLFNSAQCNALGKEVQSKFAG